MLYEAMQAYANNTVGIGIVYSSSAYPIIQILYDGLTDLGADTSGMIRPDLVATE